MIRGRPKYSPTKADRLAVTALVACGTRQDIVARHFGIDGKTLRKHFKAEIAEASVDANAMVAKTLFQEAMSGNVACMIFWLKARAHWREIAVTEVTGLGGGPLSLMVGRAGEPIADAATAQRAYEALIRNPAMTAAELTFAPAAAAPMEPLEARSPEPLPVPAFMPVAVPEPACEPLAETSSDNVVLFERLGK